MTEEQLISAVYKRANNPETRTDYSKIRAKVVGPPATSQSIEATERSLGFSLHPLHRRLLKAVGNGGFGPGDGLIGTADGSLDVDGRSLCELRDAFWPDTNVTLVPLCDWGGGIWSCVDAATGSVVSFSEFGLFNTGQSLHSWLEKWVAGDNLWLEMVVPETTIVQNPRTKEYTTVATVQGMKGDPYIASTQ
ncbi:SMI1/KNR4 family protein [Bradyrhizobium erythrophlei]|uniref:SMI1/KNR4 family protein n=1 Tax=Bradyrhizobium erythrophlei TaxID=1437360 RepID=UPI00115FAACF|nr:SMI1/KNR4 family protein [Bradyrhizobium erythrophlei]